MGLTAKVTGNGDFKSVDPGTHVARCIGVYDLGTKDAEWQGNSYKRHQIMVQWECPNELMEEGEFEGKPYSISKFYTLSLSEKANLRHDLEGWRGKAFTAEELRGFDVTKLLGVPCMLSVVEKTKQDGSKKVVVNSISTLPKGTQCPPQINESKYFSFESFDQSVFDSLSEGIQRMIMESDEYSNIQRVQNIMEDDDGAPFDDVPPPTDDDIIPF